MNLKDRIGVDLGRRVSLEDGVDWAVPELVREIKPDEMNIPVGRNNQ